MILTEEEILKILEQSLSLGVKPTKLHVNLFGETAKKVLECKRCNGDGYLAGKDYPDGSFSTERPCSCTGFISTD